MTANSYKRYRRDFEATLGDLRMVIMNKNPEFFKKTVSKTQLIKEAIRLLVTENHN